MSGNIPMAPQGNMPAIGIPDSQDIPRLVFSAPYFEQVPLAELIEPSVIEAVEAALPSLVPPYVDAAAQAAVQQLAVLLTGSTMTGPLFLSPLMPTQPSQAATMAYVDSMIATAGIPEVPPVPSGQVWARETGQWVPITPQTGVFLPLSGGSMQGNINMSGNTIQNMAAVPAMPNGAAPAQWVLNQIASVSLYQGTWNADTNVPDLTQLSTHVNAYTWIAITTAVGGVVIGAAIPGLQGMTIFNGDTIIYSTVQGQFMAIHAGGLTLPEADERYVQLAGSQMSGALLLNANASQPMQAVTLQQLDTYVPPGAVTEAPNDGQLYGRNGLTASWAPVLPLAGGILTGALTLSGNATANLNPVPLQQMTSAITAATAGLLPLAGGTMSGLMTLSGNASVALNPVPLQQLNSMLGTYAPLQNPALTGTATLNGSPIATGATLAGYLPLTGGTLTGGLIGTSASFSGNIIGVQLQVGGSGGPLWAASSGQMYCPQSVTSSGNITAVGEVIVGGLTWSNSGAYMYTPSSIDCLAIAVGNNTGVMWSFSSGYMWTAPSVAAFSFVENSDRRSKSEINASTSGLAEILQLNPITFQRPGEDRIVAGFVAQDVQPILPEAVAVFEPDDSASDVGPSTAIRAAAESGEPLLGLQYSCITAALVNAVKELNAKVDALGAPA